MIRDVCVKFIARPDGNARIEIFSRPDGLFFFEECTFSKEEFENCFIPSYTSGLYSSEDEALKEAHVIIPWLRPEISN